MLKTGQRRLLAGSALLAMGAIAIGVAINKSDTSWNGTAASSKPRGSYDHHDDQHLRRPPGQKPCPPGSYESRTRPARMLGPRSATTIPSGELDPVSNGWAAGACSGVTWVWAGASGEHPSSGRLVIARDGQWPRARIHVDVDVPGSGPLRITGAPLGPDVATSAQRGELEFTSERGITGTLDLSTDTVTLASGQVFTQTGS